MDEFFYFITDEVPLTLWVKCVSTKRGRGSNPSCPFSWVQFRYSLGKKWVRKWVSKNEVLKKVQKTR